MFNAKYFDLSDTPVCFWSARAIYKPGTSLPVDILHDRQGWSSDTPSPETQGLQQWINVRGLPLLNQLLEKKYLGSDSREVITIREFCYELKASPNASYGYLYINAGLLPTTEAGTHPNSATGREERIILCGGKKFVWGIDGAIPSVGTKGKLNVNGLGRGVVVGYGDFPYEKGSDLHIISVKVKLENPPKWWLEQSYRDYVEQFKKDNARAYSRNISKPICKTKWLKDFDRVCGTFGEADFVPDEQPVVA